MANAKNTIQNISLTGTLNLNTLKTDVKQFQGYNEKNSTVFGGELGPLWEMDIPVPPVYYDDTNPPIGVPLNWTKDMQYPLFNSKGDCFVIDVGKYDDRREFSLYKRNNPIFIYNTDDIIQNSAATFNIPYVSKLNIKEHADFVGYLDKNSNDESFKVVYNKKFYSYTGMSERVRNYINNILFKNKDN